MFSGMDLFSGERLIKLEVSSQTAGCLIGAPARGGRMRRDPRIGEGREKDWKEPAREDQAELEALLCVEGPGLGMRFVW